MKLFILCLVFCVAVFVVDAFCSQEKHTGFFGGIEDKFCALFGHPHHDDEKIPPIHPDDHKPLPTSTEKQTTIKPEESGGKNSNSRNDPNDNKKPPKKTTKLTTKKTSKAPIHPDDHILLPTEKQPKINAEKNGGDNSGLRSNSNDNKKPPKKTSKAPIYPNDHILLPTEKQPKINSEDNDNSKPRRDSNVNKKPPKKTTKAPKITSITIGGEEDDY